VGDVAAAQNGVVASLLFGDDSTALRTSYPSSLSVCAAAASSQACAGSAGARVQTSFAAALLDRTAPLTSAFGDAVVFGAGNVVECAGATLDMAQPLELALVDELLQLSAIAGAVATDAAAQLRDEQPDLFVLHLSALGALTGDAAHDAAVTFTAALLPKLVAQWNALTARPIDTLLFLAPPTRVTEAETHALRAAHASLAGLMRSPLSFDEFLAALPLVELSVEIELPRAVRATLCGAHASSRASSLFVFCPREVDAANAPLRVAARRRLLAYGIDAPKGANYTLAEIEEYQVSLWTTVGLVLSIGAAIYLLTTIDPGADPSGMFAKFDVQADMGARRKMD
tara:strand:- start:108 stop:1133 length:1026 start_codon:yes stop_codon:yes gene_type:complete